MTPKEIAYHLKQCEAPSGLCIVCDIAKAAIREERERLLSLLENEDPQLADWLRSRTDGETR